MAEIYETHFEYGSFDSTVYDLVFANVKTDRFADMAGEISDETLFNRRDKKFILADTDYSDSQLEFDVDIVTCDNRVLSKGEQRAISKALFNRASNRKLYFNVDDDIDGTTYETIDGDIYRLYLNCRFVNPEKLEYNGGVVGYRATLIADSNMLWQDALTYTFTINGANSTATTNIVVDTDTDMDEYIYPTVTMVMGSSGGDVTIYNATDDTTRLTEFSDLTAGSAVIMKGNLNYISGSNYYNFTTPNFIRLLDGSNTLIVRGNILTMNIEFNNRRFL